MNHNPYLATQFSVTKASSLSGSFKNAELLFPPTPSLGLRYLPLRHRLPGFLISNRSVLQKLYYRQQWLRTLCLVAHTQFTYRVEIPCWVRHVKKTRGYFTCLLKSRGIHLKEAGYCPHFYRESSGTHILPRG